MVYRIRIAAVAFLLALAGCQPDEQAPQRGHNAPGQAGAAPVREQDPLRIMRGEQLFQQNCTVCHGQRAEGVPNWQYRDAEGRFPPPPLNGTAHAWHHPRAELHYLIKHGTGAMGGNMPAWKGTLSDAEIHDIIIWFQSLWPDEVYAAWYEIDRRSRQP